MSGNPVDVGTCTDNYNDKIVVSQLDGSVCVQFFHPNDKEFVGMWFDSAERDAFIKLWAEAERRAEAHAGRRDGHGEADG